MRKRSIIREGRKALRSQYGQLREAPVDPRDVERFVREVPKEHALHAGKQAIGLSLLTRDSRYGARNVGSYVAGSHAAAYLVRAARAEITEEEALAAFNARQQYDKIRTGIGVIGLLVVGGLVASATQQDSLENEVRHNPPATSTSLESRTDDPASIQSTMPTHEQTRITPATPIPSPTGFNFQR